MHGNQRIGQAARSARTPFRSAAFLAYAGSARAPERARKSCWRIYAHEQTLDPGRLLRRGISPALMAQPTQRPGLYETTSAMTWQQSPMPNGIQMPGGGPHTTQACITQEIIDKYGAPTPPQSPRAQCHLADVNKTADWVCTGGMVGTATVSSTWTANGNATRKVHCSGNMRMGPRSLPIEWSIESTSACKGPDCGNVKPIRSPAQ